MNRIARGQFGAERAVGGFVHFAIDFGFDSYEFLLFENSFAHEKEREFRQRIAMRFLFALGRGLVELFVVGERVGIRTRDMRVNQRRPAARAAMRDGARHYGVSLERLSAVTFFDAKARVIRDELRNVAAGGLHFDGDGDGEAIVLHDKENGQLAIRGDIEGFEEFSLAGGAFAAGNVGDFIALVSDAIAERGALGLLERFRKFVEITGGLGYADGLYPLRAGGRGSRDEMDFLVAPVRRHLTARGAGTFFRADGFEKHLERRHAEH